MSHLMAWQIHGFGILTTQELSVVVVVVVNDPASERILKQQRRSQLPMRKITQWQNTTLNRLCTCVMG